MTDYRLSRHAAAALREREIRLEWLELALATPQRTERDADAPRLLHALRTIPEFGDRVLRVIYNPTVEPVLVVTVYFDRGMKGKL